MAESKETATGIAFADLPDDVRPVFEEGTLLEGVLLQRVDVLQSKKGNDYHSVAVAHAALPVGYAVGYFGAFKSTLKHHAKRIGDHVDLLAASTGQFPEWVVVA